MPYIIRYTSRYSGTFRAHCHRWLTSLLIRWLTIGRWGRLAVVWRSGVAMVMCMGMVVTILAGSSSWIRVGHISRTTRGGVGILGGVLHHPMKELVYLKQTTTVGDNKGDLSLKGCKQRHLEREAREERQTYGRLCRPSRGYTKLGVMDVCVGI